MFPPQWCPHNDQKFPLKMRLCVISIAFTKYEAIGIRKHNEETDLLVWKQKVRKIKEKSKKRINSYFLVPFEMTIF